MMVIRPRIVGVELRNGQILDVFKGRAHSFCYLMVEGKRGREDIKDDSGFKPRNRKNILFAKLRILE